jgi:hypothetical protein
MKKAQKRMQRMRISRRALPLEKKLKEKMRIASPPMTSG